MHSKRIPFNHTPIQAFKHKKKLLKRFSDVIQSGKFLNGVQVTSLEEKLNSYFGKYFLTCASGHDALFLALCSLQLTQSDEVLFPVNAYPTAFPVYLVGAKGVPVDVDENGQISPEDLERKLTSKTKVIIIVHLYGLVGQLSKIFTILKNKRIFIIEDCAQAFGTTYKKKLVGTLGDIGCFSFYPTKIIGTLGDGGGIWTKHRNIFNYLIRARAYGAKTVYKSDFISGHSRLPELQAAALHVYFGSFQKEAATRRKLYKVYRSLFAKLNLYGNLSLLASDPESDPVLHLFSISVKKRNKLQNFLQKRAISTYIHYPYPIHKVPAFMEFTKLYGTFPHAERFAKQILSLPFHHYLKKRDIYYIVNEIKKFYDHS